MSRLTSQTIAQDEEIYQLRLLDEQVKSGRISREEAKRRKDDRDKVRAEYKRVTV